MRDVGQRLSDLAGSAGDRPALHCGQGGRAESLTWRELDQRTAALARELTSADRSAVGGRAVVARVDNDISSAVTVLAGLRARLPVVPLDPRATDAEREHVTRQLDAAGPERLNDVPYLLTTGGSTGLPKLIAQHGPVGYDPRRSPNPVLRRAGWRAGQTQLLVLPLHHAAGFMCFVEGVLAGETVVLQADFVASDMWRLVARHRVGWTLLTPTHMRLALPEAGNPPALSILHTGGPCDPGLKRAWIDLLGAGNVYEMYGATEGIGTTVIRGDEWLARPGSVGRPVCGQIRILDPERAVLPADAIGEVYLRVPGRRGAPRGAPGGATTPDGFRSAGDRGWLDEDGYLFLAGRSDDMIIVGGENVYPAEIEAVLREVPGIRDVAVVGRPDPLLGERIVAYVVARGATVREDVLRYCVGRLSLRKLPKDVLFVSELPRTAAGKLQRWRLDREAPAAGAATQKMPTNTQQG